MGARTVHGKDHPLSAPHNWPQVPRLLTAALTAAAVCVAVALLVWQVRRIPLPFYFDYEEGNILNAVSLIESGKSIYPKPGGLPVVINPYPPVYYYVAAAATRLFGYSFTPGRAISLGASLLVALGIGLAIRRRARSWNAALLGASFYLMTVPSRAWGLYMRVDTLAVALAFWGFYLAIFSGRLYVPAVLFLAALLTKHTTLAAPAAVVVAWWLEGRRREAVRLAVIVGAGGAAAFGLLDWATGGAFFIYMFFTHADAAIPAKWLREMSLLGRMAPVVLVLAVWLVVDQAREWWRARTHGGDAPWEREPARVQSRAVSVYLLLAFLATATGMKIGSNWNHYLEFWAAACLAAGCATGALRERISIGPLLWIALALQTALLAPSLLLWLPARWGPQLHAVILAVTVGACAYRALQKSRLPAAETQAPPWAAVLAATAFVTFPGVWNWTEFLPHLWPLLLSVAAAALLLQERPEAAALAALGATIAGAAIPAVVVPVAWALLHERAGGAKGTRRYAIRRPYLGVLLLAAVLAAALVLSRGANPFHSPSSPQLDQHFLVQQIQPLALLGVLAIAALYAGPPPALIIYAATALAFTLVFRDLRLWLEVGLSLSMLSAAAVCVEDWRPARVLAPLALAVQLVLLTPYDFLLSPASPREKLRELYAAVAAAPDPVLAEHPGLLSIARKPLLVSNPFVFKQSPRFFPEEPLLEKLRNQEIPLVVMMGDPWAPEFPTGNTHLAWSQRVIDTLKKYYRKSVEYHTEADDYYFLVPIDSPREYTCSRASGPITVDGVLEEPAWQRVPWTEEFQDIEGANHPVPRFRTHAKLLWDDHYLYVAAELEEPHVWATLTRHDSVVFHDNDFELFLDPEGSGRNYYEVEINALGTVFDLFLPKPYHLGGKADVSWDMSGARTAVKIYGTLNDPHDTDNGWTLEMALPWEAFRQRASRAAPPPPGDRWRLNFSRVEWQHDVVDGKYRKRPGTREDNWVWSAQGRIDMHRPERWGYLRFAK